MHIGINDTADRAACLARLAAADPYTVDGCTAEEIAPGCTLLDVFEDGRIVGAVAVEIRGDIATIKAAAGACAVTYAHLILIEAALAARGVRFVGMFTKRPGLVRQLIARGYDITQCELLKEIGRGKQVIQ